MLYLLDANVLITAHNSYYPIDQVPEFWSWLHYHGKSGRIKIPREILEEVLGGNKEDDLLLQWLKDREIREALTFDGSADADVLRVVISTGYAADLSDDEIEQLGRDPFLIAYALKNGHCVVTTEVSRPSKRRQNRKIPDVCKDLSVECCGPFTVNKKLGFHTAWKPEG